MRKLIIAAILSIVCVIGWFSYSQSKPVVLIGFVGGLSGRTADLGIAGRDGAMLAVNIRNKSGGINGRQIELLIEDDKQDAEAARKAVSLMISRGVEAIVGPMTSDMAIASLPIANATNVLLISPTVTTNALTGIDDQFFRVIGSTSDYAKINAQHHYQNLGLRRVVVIYDLANKTYSDSWSKDYRFSFEKFGGKVINGIGYVSGRDLNYSQLVRDLAKLQFDGALVIGNSVDAAMFAQIIRRKYPKVQVMTSEWAATERFIELGGRAVEGITVAQFFDRESSNSSYLAFLKDYKEHHSDVEPGFAGLTAFEATNIVLDAIEKKVAGQSLKQAILSQKKFDGLQGKIIFDEYGDSHRDTHMVTIKNAKYIRIGAP